MTLRSVFLRGDPLKLPTTYSDFIALFDMMNLKSIFRRRGDPLMNFSCLIRSQDDVIKSVFRQKRRLAEDTILTTDSVLFGFNGTF